MPEKHPGREKSSHRNQNILKQITGFTGVISQEIGIFLHGGTARSDNPTLDAAPYSGRFIVGETGPFVALQRGENTLEMVFAGGGGFFAFHTTGDFSKP